MGKTWTDMAQFIKEEAVPINGVRIIFTDDTPWIGNHTLPDELFLVHTRREDNKPDADGILNVYVFIPAVANVKPGTKSIVTYNPHAFDEPPASAPRQRRTKPTK